MSSAAAARPKWPSSATETKNRRWRIRSISAIEPALLARLGRSAVTSWSVSVFPVALPLSTCGDIGCDSSSPLSDIGFDPVRDDCVHR